MSVAGGRSCGLGGGECKWNLQAVLLHGLGKLNTCSVPTCHSGVEKVDGYQLESESVSVVWLLRAIDRAVDLL